MTSTADQRQSTSTETHVVSSPLARAMEVATLCLARHLVPTLRTPLITSNPDACLIRERREASLKLPPSILQPQLLSL